MLLYRLTDDAGACGIRSTGRIEPRRPKELSASYPALVACWLTDDPDPAKRGWKPQQGRVTWRFEVNVPSGDALSWNDGEPPGNSGLEVSAIARGGNPASWYVVARPIPGPNGSPLSW